MKRTIYILILVLGLSFVSHAQTIIVTPATGTYSATNNDFVVLQNALSAAVSGTTLDLQGTFDFTEANAHTAYLASNNGSTGTDIRGVVIPDGINNLTITSTTSAHIIGAGDVTDVPSALIAAACFYTENDATATGMTNLTIANLWLDNFECPIVVGWNAKGTYNGTKIQNNTIDLAGDDGDATDWLQNVAIYFWKGTNQLIENNKIYFKATGSRTVGYYGASDPRSFGYQCATSGGAAYNGLIIRNNTFTIRPAVSYGPDEFNGIWENSHNDDNSCVIQIKNNSFIGLPGKLIDNAFLLSSQTNQLLIDQNTFDHVDNIYFARSSAAVAAGDIFPFSNSVCTNVGGADGIFLKNDFGGAFKVGIRWYSNNTVDGYTGARGLNQLSTQVRTNSAADDLSLVTVPDALGQMVVNTAWTGIYDRFSDPDGIGTGYGPAAAGFNIATTLVAAVAAVSDGGLIDIAAGTYTEIGQIVINKSLTISGENVATTIIKPAGNTGSVDDARAWILVGTDVALNLSHLTLDGTGKQVHEAIRFKSGPSCVVDDVNIRNISYVKYVGMGIRVYRNIAIRNSSFSNIERIGVHMSGTAVTDALVENCTYTGKGSGDWLDYAFEFENGGKGTVRNCAISNCLGVALSDGSTSAGAMATTYFGPGTTAHFYDNTFTNCSYGIAVGYDASDASTVVAHNNDFAGCTDYGMEVTSALCSVNAENNWWRSNDGPADASGTIEVPVSPEPALSAMLNAAPPLTLGVPVTDNADYYPWTMGNQITLTAKPYTFDTDGDGNADITMTFSVLPAGGGNVYINRYGSVPANWPAPPSGGLTNTYLVITSDMPNYSFDVNVVMTYLGTGFGTNTQVAYYNTATDQWVFIGGVYTDIGTPGLTSDDTFAFSTNHFTPFSFINTPTTPLPIMLTDMVVNDTYPENTIPANTETWQQWMGGGDLTNDWSWEYLNSSVSAIPMTIGADIFAATITLRYDPTDWQLTNPTGYVNGVAEGTLFTSAGYNTFFFQQAGTLGTDNTILADLSVQEAGNPMVTADAVKSLATFAFRPIAANPAPITFVSAAVRDNLNQAYYLDLSDDAKGRVYLGDVVRSVLPSGYVHNEGDGVINADDLAVWSLPYFADVSGVTYPGALGNYRLKYDLGPTTTNYIDGVPVPDGKIEFEDLVIFAISYGLSQNGSYPKSAPQQLSLSIADRACEQGEWMNVPVSVSGAVDLRALSLRIGYDTRLLAFEGALNGSLLPQGSPLFVKDEGGMLRVDAATIAESGLRGAGDIAILRFRVLRDGRSGIRLDQVLARDSRNNPVTMRAEELAVPTQVTLEQNYPNPFNPSTTIRFALPETRTTEIAVFDLLGRKVRTLVSTSLPEGMHSAFFDGRDDFGAALPSGLYIYRLVAGGVTIQRSMMLAK